MRRHRSSGSCCLLVREYDIGGSADSRARSAVAAFAGIPGLACGIMRLTSSAMCHDSPQPLAVIHVLMGMPYAINVAVCSCVAVCSAVPASRWWPWFAESIHVQLQGCSFSKFWLRLCLGLDSQSSHSSLVLCPPPRLVPCMKSATLPLRRLSSRVLSLSLSSSCSARTCPSCRWVRRRTWR